MLSPLSITHPPCDLEHTINPHPHLRRSLVFIIASTSCLGLLTACGSPTESAPNALTPATNLTTAVTGDPPATTSRTPSPAPPTSSRAHTGSSTKLNSTSNDGGGRVTATKACEAWRSGSEKNAAEGSADLRAAATQAAAAARVDAQWTHLADDMAFLSSLPLTDNTPQDVARARVAEPSVAATCKTLGIRVPT